MLVGSQPSKRVAVRLVHRVAPHGVRCNDAVGAVKSCWQACLSRRLGRNGNGLSVCKTIQLMGTPLVLHGASKSVSQSSESVSLSCCAGS